MTPAQIEHKRQYKNEWQKKYYSRPEVKKQRAKYNKKYRQSRHGKKLIREYMVRYKFGLSVEEYRRLWREQRGRCAICRKGFIGSRRLPAVDHCHKTKRVRGLLCAMCNGGIGMLKDSAKLLREAARYLETA